MKKLFAIFLVLTLAFPCYAANRLKYKIADGEVVTMGAMPQLEAGAGERVVSVDFEIPKNPLFWFTFDGEKLVKKAQPVIDKMEAEQNFSFHNLTGTLNDTMDAGSVVKLSPYVGALRSFVEWKSWSGVKGFLGALEVNGIATAEEVKLIKEGFKAQNLDIDSY